ncbi:MAG: TIGR01212 family radical SAM protein [Betaproteobacteria bacterium]|nr:TIGR01212 family radical SAM protein [Betaproteobacteria bacterium]
MVLSDKINTFGQHLLKRHRKRVHKIALDVGFTCPNRDGSKGYGGCTFCNNVSFSPDADSNLDLHGQMAKAKIAISKRTGAKRFLAYFQAYTNTYADVTLLENLYREALLQPDIIGISVGTRPDCVPIEVLELLDTLQNEGWEVWLELGLQSAFDETLVRVNRGHGFSEYKETLLAARARGIPVCTHLIIGLPGEGEEQCHTTLDKVLELGVDGLKLHPLHVVKNTLLAYQWKRGEYSPLSMDDYIRISADMIERTPEHIIFHRVTATAASDVLLAPDWCSKKWKVLNGIERELRRRGTRQGCRT